MTNLLSTQREKIKLGHIRATTTTTKELNYLFVKIRKCKRIQIYKRFLIFMAR